jgi:hypothetical protein
MEIAFCLTYGEWMAITVRVQETQILKKKKALVPETNIYGADSLDQ